MATGLPGDKLRDGGVWHRRCADVIDALVKTGWHELKSPLTSTYSSATVVNTNYDPTAYHEIGEKVRWTQTTVKYGYIVAMTSSTITICSGSDYSVTNATISDIGFSKASSPVDFPTWFNWSPTLTGFSSAPAGAMYRFKIDGRMVRVVVSMPNNGTSNATTFQITAPVTSGSVAGGAYFWGTTIWTLVNNGAFLTTPGRAYIGEASTDIILHTNMTTGAWTNANGKRAFFELGYEI